jgi:hypothetical protein
MGDLITFRPSPTPRRSNSAAAPSRDARILFFTGVRYKREAEPTPAFEQDAPPKGGMDGAGGGRRKRRG